MRNNNSNKSCACQADIEEHVWFVKRICKIHVKQPMRRHDWLDQLDDSQSENYKLSSDVCASEELMKTWEQHMREWNSICRWFSELRDRMWTLVWIGFRAVKFFRSGFCNATTYDVNCEYVEHRKQTVWVVRGSRWTMTEGSLNSCGEQRALIGHLKKVMNRRTRWSLRHCEQTHPSDNVRPAVDVGG